MKKELYQHSNGDNLYYRHLEFSETIDMAEAIRRKRDHYSNSSVSGDRRFTGTNNLAEAIKLARLGWEDGISKIEKYLDEIDTDDLFSDAINRPEIFRDVHGTVVDVAGYIQGIPEHMVSLTFEQRPTRAVKLIIAVDQHAYVSQEDMIQKTTSIFLAAEALRRTGYILDITGIDYRSSRGYGHDNILYEFPILRPGDYLSSAQLAFMLGHPSFLRRILFAVNETEEEGIRDKFGFKEGYGYGTPQTLKKATLKKAGTIDKGDDSVIYIVDKDDGFGDILKQAKKIVAGIRKLSEKQMGIEHDFEREFA